MKGPTFVLIQSFSLSLLFVAFVNVLDSLSAITNDVIQCLHEAPCDAWHQQVHLTSLCLLLTSCEKLTNKKRKYVETSKLFKGWSYEGVKKTSTVISTANCCLWAIHQQQWKCSQVTLIIVLFLNSSIYWLLYWSHSNSKHFVIIADFHKTILNKRATMLLKKDRRIFWFESFSPCAKPHSPLFRSPPAMFESG